MDNRSPSWCAKWARGTLGFTRNYWCKWSKVVYLKLGFFRQLEPATLWSWSYTKFFSLQYILWLCIWIRRDPIVRIEGPGNRSERKLNHSERKEGSWEETADNCLFLGVVCNRITKTRYQKLRPWLNHKIRIPLVTLTSLFQTLADLPSSSRWPNVATRKHFNLNFNQKN